MAGDQVTRLRRDFGIVSGGVIKNPAIGLSTKALYATICAYADDDGVCFPSNETLAHDLGCTERAVRGWMGELVDLGVLVREERHANGRQITSITRLTDVSIHSPRVERTDPPGGEPAFPQNKTTSNKTTNPVGGEGFDTFWALYPRRDGGKTAARKKWDTVVKTTDPAVILAGLRRQLDHLRYQTTREPGKNYCPLATTWLNQGRWEDEITTNRKEQNMFEGFQ